ncbi:hypothetical protein ElyMa_005193300 [Elysia marginata]|uniref:DUF4776 domain-containing protein n=1 Tax=Elysia marginata TaxID=1093978 RepID=A0AAV4JTS3_9GAST|nr:hypothetical protein ElyMa_005193300 [Elysia marginata]
MLPPAPTLTQQFPPTVSPRHGYQENLLGSSLVARLKQRQTKEAAKPPKPTKNKPALKKTKAELGLKLEGLLEDDVNNSDDGQFESPKESKTALKTQCNYHPSHRQRPRDGSAASVDTGHKLPRLTSASRSPTESRISSRRSLSAGPAQERGDSRRSMACPSASSFAQRAPSCPVHIVKRDGVFQPADKYMPGRTLIREAGPATLWDYHTYVLPMMDSNSDTQSPRFSDPDISPRGMYITSGKKRMKVSWKAGSHPDLECPNGVKLPESRQDTNPTPSTTAPASANKQKRAQSVDNLAFRRPVYNSGLSRVSSIGLKWEIQTGSTGQLTNTEPLRNGSASAAPPKDESQPTFNSQPYTTTPKPTSKPMWSYLITHDTKQDQQLHQFQPSSSGTISRSKPKDSKSSGHGRHYRDVHPVSTAMERNGTSVSKTRWTVPSSSASGLEAERAVRDRLQLVKRTGSLWGRGTSNSAAQRFQQAMAAAGRTHSFDGEHESVSQKSKGQGGEKDETLGSNLSADRGRMNKGEKLTQEAISETNDEKPLFSREDDQVSSPTKSRSTVFN